MWNTNGLVIKHYNGVDYHCVSTNRTFRAFSTLNNQEEDENSEAISSDLEFDELNNLESVSIKKYAGISVVDEKTYEYISENVFDIINRDSKRFRYQIEKNMITSSFEVLDEAMFDEDNCYNGLIRISDISSSGSFDSHVGECCTHISGDDYIIPIQGIHNGICITVFGFFKRNLNASYPNFEIQITHSNNVISRRTYTNVKKGEWFLYEDTFTFLGNSGNGLYLSTTDSISSEIKNLKYIVHSNQLNQESLFLIDKNTHEMIPLGNDYKGFVKRSMAREELADTLSFNDLFAYCVNQKRNTHVTEVYCGDLPYMISDAQSFAESEGEEDYYLEIECNNNTYAMRNYNIGKRFQRTE